MFWLLLIFGIFQCFSTSHTQSLVVTTKYGPIRGFIEEKTLLFLGVPYASPPVKNLRFASPQPPTTWENPINTTQWAPACWNAHGGTIHQDQSEDCLYLNVFVPIMDTSNVDLPVMFFIHGGGFQSGSPAMYPPTKLPPIANAIVVSAAYRLNTFGYFTMSDFNDTPVNWGLQDQQFAMKWTKENIAAFGGSPDNVMIFGQSAGGAAVSAHLVMESSYGLYSSAIMQSAGGRDPWNWGEDTEDFLTKKEAIAAGDAFATKMGCTSPGRLDCMRKLGATQIITRKFAPSVDGFLLNDIPLHMVRKGLFNPVPIMLGATSCEACQDIWDEIGLPPPINGTKPITDTKYTASLSKVFGDVGSDTKIWYQDYDKLAGHWRSFARIVGDAGHTCNTHFFAEILASNTSVYRYIFNHATKDWPKYFLNATHCSEMPYLFQDAVNVASHYIGYKSFTADEEKLAQTMGRMWGNFARFHNPNKHENKNSDFVSWPAYDAKTRQTMFFEIPSSIKSIELEDRCPHWSKYM